MGLYQTGQAGSFYNSGVFLARPNMEEVILRPIKPQPDPARKRFHNGPNFSPATARPWRTVAAPAGTYHRRPPLNVRLSETSPDRSAQDPLNQPAQSPQPNPAPGANIASQLKNRQLILWGRMALDIALICAVFILAYIMRYSLQIGSEVLESNQVPLSEYYGSMAAFAGIFFLVLQFKSFYRQTRMVSLLDEMGIIASAAAYAVLTMLALVFIFRPFTGSRLMYLYLFPVACLALGLERAFTRRLKRSLRKRGIGLRNVLVVGATDSATRIMHAVVDTPSLGLRLAGYVDDELRFSEWTLPLRFKDGSPVPHLGDIDRLPGLTAQHKVDEIIVALPATMHETINAIINLCHENEITFTLVPDIFELQVNALDFQELNGVPLIGIRDNQLTGFNYLVKRGVDLALALTLLAVAAIPMLLIALAIKIDSKGPIILRQTRIGKNGQGFTFYKFRSMYNDADQRLEELKAFNQTGGATFKMTNDPRRTRVGRIIRRSSLDELPQVFNILAGHMSFVGPRPGLERELKDYKDWYFRRLEVTPGLTGLSQVSGRSNLQFNDTVRLDIYYAENWSLWLDLKILLRTILVVLKREGAY